MGVEIESSKSVKCLNVQGRRKLLTKLENFDSSQASSKMANSLKVILCLSLNLTIFASLIKLANSSMSLPDGIDNILGFIPKSSFKCERDGYFGDVDNDCKLFHLCQKQVSSNGKVEWRHWTYACGNQTMFNQLTLTCAFVDEAIPCRHASQFQYLNEVINKPSEPFLTDADVTSGFSYYSNRIMSDGARTRAFEDSSLMAQLGGANNIESQPAAPQPPPQPQAPLQKAAPPKEPATFANEEVATNPEGGKQFINSVDFLETPQTFSENFFAQSQPNQQQQFQLASGNQVGSDLIINHQHHFQHQNQLAASNLDQQLNNERQQLFSIQQSQPFEGNNQFLQQQFNNQFLQQQFPSENSFVQPTNNLNQREQQQQQQNFADSFDFSISTNHQVGSPSTFSSFSQHFNQRAPESSASPATTQQVPSQQVTTTAASTGAQRSSTTFGSASPNLVPTFGPVEKLSAPITTPAAPTTTQRQPAAQTAAPTTTVAAITTTAAASPAPSTEGQPSSTVGAPRLAGGAQQRKRQPASQRQLRGAFQSARLSSMPKEPAKQQESAIVMRRSMPVADAPQPAQSSRVATGPVERVNQFDGIDDFWNKKAASMEASLMPPKFESLLTRRRV